MPYAVLENLASGVDRSRPRYVFQPGAMWSGINGHVNRGGDFEKRKAFVSKYSLPAGTFGLARTTTGLYVFGSAATPGGIPTGVTYQRLQHPTAPGAVMTRLYSWDLYDGKIYAIAGYDNGDVRHFYDTAAVTEMGAGGTKPPGWGTLVMTHGRKVHAPINSIDYFSKIDTAVTFDTASGAGFQNMNTAQGGSETITAMSKYQDKMVFFSRTMAQVWSMPDDPANNASVTILGDTGTKSPRAARPFGDLDTFYLSDAGIRSLRARNYTNTAGVNDVGTPIDPAVLEWMDAQAAGVVEAACAITDPRDGRFWLVIGERVFVFSYFPSKKISAWSWYEPGFTIGDLVSFGGRIYARSGDVIYLYGGDSNAVYGNDYDVTVALPFMTVSKDATFKQWRGMDVATTGDWECSLLINPNDENDVVYVGTLGGVTFPEETIAAVGHATHIAPVLVHRGEGYASLSKIALEYEGAEAK